MTEHEAIHIPKAVLYQAINVVILIGVLYYFTKQKIKDYFSSRATAHEKAKENAAQAYKEAETQHKDVVLKLTNLKKEETAFVEKAQAEAKELKSKLIREADQIAHNMIQDAKKTAAFELEKAKQDLRKEALEEALLYARENIQKTISPADQKNLEKQFVNGIGAAQ